jgi:uncharacterized protein DUF559
MFAGCATKWIVVRPCHATAMSVRLIVASKPTGSRVRELHVNGEVRRLRRGVYTTGSGDSVIEQVAAAAVRLDAVASHETAEALWGIPTLGRAEHLRITRERRHQGATRRFHGLKVHHARLSPAHVTEHRGVRITTPERTVIDIARSRAFRSGVVAADAALRMKLCTEERLRATIETCRRWPGLVRARKVVAFANSRSGSPLESISRVAFHEYGLPPPILQAIIGGYEEVDFLWPKYRVVGEADGLSKYTSVEDLRHEKLRQDGISQLGFTMVRWTWSEVYRRPDALAHRVLESLVRNGYRPL